MKIVYFGSDVFLSCFEYLTDHHQVLALYTYHQDEDYFTEYSIAEKARQLGIPVHYEDISSEDIARYRTREGCDLFFIAEYDRILPLPEGLPQLRGINTHCSLLPRGRSYYPIEAAMERGETVTGVTMHKLAESPDTGDILAQRTIRITPEMDSIDIYLQCAARAREMLEEIMADPEGFWGSAPPCLKKEDYWRRPADSLLTLTHSMTCREAAELFRNYNMMTQLLLSGQWYHVSALDTGVTPIPDDLRFLSPTRVLYRVRDGHLRLQVQPMEVQP